jgi:predicted ribosomally synthesized peptide with SipW-like signal peptide
MKKILIKVLIVALVAVLSVIGTLAYLTATDEATNVMVVDDASIEIVEYERVNTDDTSTSAAVQAFNNNKRLRPSVLANGATYAAPNASYNASFSVDANTGEPIKANYTYPVWNPNNITNEIDKMVFVKNTGDCNVYVRLCFAFEAGNYVRLDRFKEMVHLNSNTTDWTWDWSETRLAEIDGTRCFIAWATYQKPVAPGELTDISLAQIALDHTAINDHARAFGDTYEVKVFAQGIQSDGFATADLALSSAFDNSIPFDKVKFLEFTDLKTALHYLNADTNDLMLKGGDHNKQEPASDAVNSVTFGLTKDHPDVAKNRNGVLVANVDGEADFTAYAYYVPNGDKYDVYFLADDWEIYAPSSSNHLFYRMAGLTEVDTSNLNFSGATTFQDMFRDCKSLIELDTSDWDVSKVTSMNYMFQNCIKLNNIDVSGWNTANVTAMQYMFYKCGKFTSLDVSNWNVSNLTAASYMFRECSNLTYLDVSRWKVDNLSGANEMFNGCGSLQKLDVSDWKLSKVKNFNAMFQNCSSLVYLDVSKWTIDSATDTSAMFNGCKNLKVLDVSKFDVSKVTTMQTMFNNCSSLKSLDLSSWNVSSVTNMVSMFNSCSGLEYLNVSNFDVSKVTSMETMFNNCSSLKSLDLSSWNVSSVTNMAGMFSYCSGLESLNVSTWNVSKVTDMSNMFERCKNLTELDLSGWDTKNLVNTEYMFSECNRLKTIYVSECWNMGKVTSSGSMFLTCFALVGGGSNKLTYGILRVDAAYANYTDGYLTYRQYTPTNTTP